VKGRIIYLKNHDASTKQAEEAEASLSKFGWDVQLTPGYTAETVQSGKYAYNILPNGRLSCFEGKKFFTKKACVMNHISFWNEVIQKDEPMAFFEHDVIACAAPDFALLNFVKDFCFLSMDYAFDWGALAGKFRWRPEPTLAHEIRDFPQDYPLIHHRMCMYNGAQLTPGTAAYVVTPSGAKKLIAAAQNYGLEQSDYIINSHNVKMQYYAPSVCKYNTVNLSTSNAK
jgi:GR25 family glycosyltransferase involved in LPS biosynthesis